MDRRNLGTVSEPLASGEERDKTGRRGESSYRMGTWIVYRVISLRCSKGSDVTVPADNKVCPGFSPYDDRKYHPVHQPWCQL